jgi:hypothetical protein
MSYDHFPGLNNAGANARFLHNNQIPELLTSGDGRPIKPALSHLKKLNELLVFGALIGELTVSDITELPPSNTWDELDEAIYGHISGQIDEKKTYTPNLPIDPIAFHKQDEQNMRMKHATKAALGLMMATYEVIPRLVFNREFENPDKDIGSIAHNTKLLFIDWMRLSGNTDRGITYALTNPKSKHGVFQSFFGMRFDPKWFEVVDDKPRIKTEKIPHMTMLWESPDLKDSYKLVETPGPVAINDKPKDVLFGCPASNFISRVHGEMVEKAVADGLFSATYYAERKNYGYND